MIGSCIVFNPCFKCDEKEKCNICELTYYRNGYIKSPAADVVEVVRCKDCKYFTEEMIADDLEYICKCFGGMINISPDYYCSYGERREE